MLGRGARALNGAEHIIGCGFYRGRGGSAGRRGFEGLPEV